MDEGCHGEPTIEKLLAESCCHCKDEIGNQLHSGLRENPLRDGLQRPPSLKGHFTDAPQVQPLKSRNRRGAENRGNKNPGSVLDRQTKLGSRKSVRPGAPSHHCYGEPLKGNGRGVKGDPLHPADVWHRQQFLHARSSAPRQNHAEHKKNQPDVPGHPRIRTLSLSAAHVPKVPRSRSISEYSIYRALPLAPRVN